MAQSFNIGDAVTHISLWRGKGIFAYRHAVVQKWTPKWLTMADSVTGEDLGKFHRIELASPDSLSRNGWAGIFYRLTDAEAEHICIAAGNAYVAELCADFERKIRMFDGQKGTQKYADDVKRDLATWQGIKGKAHHDGN